MTIRGAADVGFLLIDGYDALGWSTQLEDNLEALLEETHALGDRWVKQSYTGVKQAEIRQEGFYDTDEAQSNDALSGKTGESRLLCYGLEGNTVGKRFIGYSGALQTNFIRVASRGELHKANANYQGAGAVEEGEILHPHLKREDDGDTEDDPVSVGSQTTEGGVGYLQVSDINLDDYDDVLIKILHSTDESTWETLLEFDPVSEAPASERKLTPNETVRKHLAVEWEFRTGSGTDQDIKFFVGFKRE